VPTLDKAIPNAEVIPVYESDIFADNPEARFAVGIIAVGSAVKPGLENEFDAYRRLRANVYVDQTHMVGRDHVEADGREKLDADDPRAVHFGVFEQTSGGTRAVGSLRLIVKDEQDDRPLPIEDFFTEAFEGGPAPLGSVEASRYIARHEKGSTQRMLSGMILAAGVSYIRNHGLGPTYGTVEPKVERAFVHRGVPHTRIAEPVYVEEYNADNLGLEIAVNSFADRIEEQEPGLLSALAEHEGNFMYFGQVALTGTDLTSATNPAAPTAEIGTAA
jgi:N-acyl-L-homoserine lactone synthetase